MALSLGLSLVVMHDLIDAFILSTASGGSLLVSLYVDCMCSGPEVSLLIINVYKALLPSPKCIWVFHVLIVGKVRSNFR